MRSLYRNYVKRILDVLVSALALVILGPLLLMLAVLVRWRLGSPVLFRQPRPGKGGEPFILVKFRTMSDARDEDGRLLPDAQRLGRFGTFLRSSSLDELPELWNVVTGSMSMVGPRPLLMEYVPLYSREQSRRHEVRPGLTGWAQVHGRNTVTWEQRFALDIWYVDNISFAVDMKTLALTIGNVLTRRGITAEGDATMPPFGG
jgi:lipopolysaccharide/colanic/teichoic acid biosynthesis glycosyltransferase